MTLHIAYTRRSLEERNVFRLEIVTTLDVSVPVDNSSFSREMIELIFKSCLASIKYKCA